jgi:hypothetical protein
MSEFHQVGNKCVAVSLLLLRSCAISICSEGSILGRPNAKIALYPRISGISCEQLEHDISLGHLPPLSQDQQPFIAAACECRPFHQNSVSMDTERILGSPTAIAPLPTAPVNSYPSAFLYPSYVPISMNYPFDYPSPTNSNNESKIKQGILNALPYVIPAVLIILLCACVFLNWKSDLATPNVRPSTLSNGDGAIHSESKESEETIKERRRIVIELLFPVQDNNCTKVRNYNLNM